MGAKILPLYVNESIPKPADKLILPTNQGVYYIPFEDIIRLESDGNYTHIITKTAKYFASKTLKSLEQDLPSTIFVRIHASHLINMDHLRFKGKDFVRMSNEDVVSVSRRKGALLKF